MPSLHVSSNLNRDSVSKKELISRLSNWLANALGKSEDYVMIRLELDADMSFGASFETCAYCELASLGLEESQMPHLSLQLCDLLYSELGISPDRIYIKFESPPRATWGWNRKTFG